MKARRWSALFILSGVLLSLVGLYFYCGARLDDALRIEAQNTISTAVQEYKGLLDEYLSEQKDALKRASSMLNGLDNTAMGAAETAQLLQQGLQDTTFVFMGVLYPNGKLYGSDGVLYRVQDTELLRRAIRKESATGWARTIYSDVENAVYQTCPVYQNGSLTALLYGEFPAEKLEELADDQALSGSGSFAIIRPDGSFICSPGWSDDGNYFSYLAKTQLGKDVTVELMRRMVGGNVTGKYQTIQNGKEYYCDYRPLDIDDWYLISRMDAGFIHAKNHYFRQLGIAFGIGTGLILLLGGGIYIFLQRRQMRVLRQQESDLAAMTNNIRGGIFHYKLDEHATLGYISEGFLHFLGYSEKELRKKCDNCFYSLVYPGDRATVQREVSKKERQAEARMLEYRMEKKNGEVVWVYDQSALMKKGKDDWVYVTVLDITQSKNVQEELQVSEECFHLIMEKTDSIIFQWDIPQDRITVTDVWDKKFGYLLAADKDFSKDVLSSITFEDDLVKNRKLFSAVKSGKHYGEELVRIRRADDTYIWCRVCLSGMAYRNQLPQRGVGVVIDIDKEKRELEEMQAMAERDSLSTLYNKGTTRRVISNFLSNEGRTHRHAFMMVDIDNFKRINDTLGHMYGDAAIADVAAVLKSAFRVSDVLGRIGGDEFVVFVKDISSREMMVEKAGELCRLFQTCYAGQNKEIQITASVGVAMFYEDGVSYDQLYRASDIALYRSKRNGKNQFTFYDASMADDEFCSVNTPVEHA